MSTTVQSKVDKLFPPSEFNESPVSNLLLTKEKNIFWYPRSRKENTEIYNTFDELFQTYLTKLPDNNVKKYVTTVFNKSMILIGASSGVTNDTVFSRILIDTSEKLSGIVLDSNSIDIDINTGETNNIDDCIYAAYFSIVRAAILTKKQDIRNNKDLHKFLSTYIYLTMLRGVGQKTIYNEKQKKLVHMACVYAYYKHFLGEKHSAVLSIMSKDYKEIFGLQMKEFVPLFDKVSKYESIKDIPKILYDLNVYHDNPSTIIISLLRVLGNAGFYSFIGSLDQLVSMVVLAKYPTNLFLKTTMVSEKIHDNVEKIMSTYIDDLEYGITSLISGK